MSRGPERPYVTLVETDRPFAEEHHDAVHLLVIDTLRQLTGTLVGELLQTLNDTAADQVPAAAQQVMEKAYFTSLGGQLRLMGVKEIAQFLGITHQRVDQLHKSHSKFPAPVAQLACGSIWLAPDIERFLAAWDRKPGRPKKIKEEGKT